MCCEVSPRPSPLQDGQSQLSQPISTGEVPHHLDFWQETPRRKEVIPHPPSNWAWEEQFKLKGNCFTLLSILTGVPLPSVGASPLSGSPEEPRTSCCSTPPHKNIPLCLPTPPQAAPQPSGAWKSSLQGQALPWGQDNNFCPTVAVGHSFCCHPHPTAEETQTSPPDPEGTSDGKRENRKCHQQQTTRLRKPPRRGRLHCLVISLMIRVNWELFLNFCSLPSLLCLTGSSRAAAPAADWAQVWSHTRGDDAVLCWICEDSQNLHTQGHPEHGYRLGNECRESRSPGFAAPV